MELTFKPFCAQISNIKFISEVNDTNQQFLVGSHMEANNVLSLMRYDFNVDNNNDEPTTLCTIRHDSDVMDIQYNANYRRVLTGASNGSLSLYRLAGEDESQLELEVGWEGVCGGPIAGCLFNNDRVVAVSEKGEIVGLRFDTSVSEVCKGFEFSIMDSSSVCAIEEIDNNTFVTVNTLGQIKSWDIRTSTKKPTWSNYRCGEMATLHCLARHPGQPNIIASGSSRGSVFIWDTRATELGAPVQLNTGVDNSNIWNLRFHPTNPNHLFLAASSSGLLDISGQDPSFNWANSSRNSNNDNISGGTFHQLSLRSIVGSSRVNMTCLDVSGSLIVAATDKEMLCLVPLALL